MEGGYGFWQGLTDKENAMQRNIDYTANKEIGEAFLINYTSVDPKYEIKDFKGVNVVVVMS